MNNKSFTVGIFNTNEDSERIKILKFKQQSVDVGIFHSHEEFEKQNIKNYFSKNKSIDIGDIFTFIKNRKSND